MEKPARSNRARTINKNNAMAINNIATLISSTVTVMYSRRMVRIASKQRVAAVSQVAKLRIRLQRRRTNNFLERNFLLGENKQLSYSNQANFKKAGHIAPPSFVTKKQLDEGMYVAFLYSFCFVLG